MMGQLTTFEPPSRIEEALAGITGTRFLLAYGPGVSDEFICPDYCSRSLDEVLHLSLKSCGFERVVF